MCIIYVEIQIPYTCRCVYTIICMFSQQTLYKLDIICHVHNYACRDVCSSLPIEVLANFLCTCTVCHPVVCWQGGRNALHLSAQGGHLEVIRFLSPRFGAKVHDRTDAGYTILHWAAQKGHSQVARYLIKELNRNPKDRDKVCGVQGKMCSTVLGLHASCMCVHMLLCAVRHATKWSHLTCSCNVVSKGSPVLCLQSPIWSLTTGSCLVVTNFSKFIMGMHMCIPIPLECRDGWFTCNMTVLLHFSLFLFSGAPLCFSELLRVAVSL